MRPILFLAALAPACAETTVTDDSFAADALTLWSDAFADGDALPDDLRCERDGGDGASPPLAWSDPAEVAVSFALTMTVAEADNHYWLLWDIPAGTRSLSRGNAESVGTEGSNKDEVDTGYTPPCAPPDSAGTHTYTITLMALDGDPVDLPDTDDVSVDLDVLTAAVDGLVAERATISFTN
ncbi:MAG: YbhB/YbcL family Raf kinase inhibitor-like protein [Alphaproteobacteria bacterium]|nr:YbhB/YbcL family Raf kinase inhibitor-like protein [Alphaproteobacteria bacterium]